MYILQITLKVKRDCKEQVIEKLKKILPLILSEQGCMEADVLCSQSHWDIVLLQQTYRSIGNIGKFKTKHYFEDFKNQVNNYLTAEIDMNVIEISGQRQL